MLSSRDSAREWRHEDRGGRRNRNRRSPCGRRRPRARPRTRGADAFDRRRPGDRRGLERRARGGGCRHRRGLEAHPEREGRHRFLRCHVAQPAGRREGGGREAPRAARDRRQPEVPVRLLPRQDGAGAPDARQPTCRGPRCAPRSSTSSRSRSTASPGSARSCWPRTGGCSRSPRARWPSGSSNSPRGRRAAWSPSSPAREKRASRTWSEPPLGRRASARRCSASRRRGRAARPCATGTLLPDPTLQPPAQLGKQTFDEWLATLHE